MNNIKLAVLAALIGASGVTMAAYDASTDAARQERMQAALDNYHSKNGSSGSAASGDARNSQPGPAARTEETIKRGARNTGHAIANGARKVGHAVGTGLRKTGSAINHAGEKLKSKTADQ
jgi:hypothetical protein